ncbi:heterokaryon incompatibility protein-domain-containing protein, partial [Sordaria brevicollis]
YACLSYKWGRDQEPVLTSNMLRGRRGPLQFQAEDLPKTIADAVFVCLSLRIGYLWVDALCIIQDDAQDKAEQIGEMQQIYSQSAITIVASRADSSEDGFLHPRLDSSEIEALGETCRLAYRSEKGETGSVILHLRPQKAPLRDPLHERGWAYQEFLLPPRIIDYGRMQTTYNCRECESTITDGGISSADALMLFIRRKGFYELWPLKDSWQLFVEECSKRQLSVPADRLNAMSAIANVFSKLTDEKDEYLAGHWRSSFPESLMWFRNWRKNGLASEVESHHAFGEYFAPSWSWPSVMGSVKFKY